MRQDYYRVLGLAPTASADEIRQAFRALARQYHPDANASDPVAAERFKVINEAYRVLGTPQLRVAYDRALRMIRPAAAESTEVGQGAARASNVKGATFPPFDAAAEADKSAGPDQRAVSDVSPSVPTLHREKPVVTLKVVPGEPGIVPPQKLTRFYLLSELGGSRADAVLDLPPLDIALLIDRSNSMKGPKLFEAKRAVRDMLDALRDDDRLTVVFFHDRAEVIADGESSEGRAGIEMALNRIEVTGSTQIAVGLEATLERFAARQNRSRIASLILLTDGLTYGDERHCLELATQARQLGVSITALGMGTVWNRDLLDRLAAISGGSSDYVEDPRHVRRAFDQVVRRLRATIASDMRVTFEPAAGVRIARATRIAPDIAEAYSAPWETEPEILPEAEAVAVELGALVGRPDIESAVVLWEVLFDPAAFTARDGYYSLGRLAATYWSPLKGSREREYTEAEVRLPVNATGQHPPITPDVRLALELVTAYRLQTHADRLAREGKQDEASVRLQTSALRLRAAGEERLAGSADSAAERVSTSLEEGISATLRVKYEVKNLSIFHRLRRGLHSA